MLSIIARRYLTNHIMSDNCRPKGCDVSDQTRAYPARVTEQFVECWST